VFQFRCDRGISAYILRSGKSEFKKTQRKLRTSLASCSPANLASVSPPDGIIAAPVRFFNARLSRSIHPTFLFAAASLACRPWLSCSSLRLRESVRLAKAAFRRRKPRAEPSLPLGRQGEPPSPERAIQRWGHAYGNVCVGVKLAACRYAGGVTCPAAAAARSAVRCMLLLGELLHLFTTSRAEPS